MARASGRGKKLIQDGGQDKKVASQGRRKGRCAKEKTG